MNAGYSPTTVVSYPGIDGAAWAWDVFAGFDSGRHHVGPFYSPVLNVLARVGYPLGRYDTLRVELAPSQLEHGEHLTVVLPHRLDVIPRTILTTRNGSYLYGGTVGVHYIPISGSPLPAGHYCVIRGQIPAGCGIEL